SWPVTMRRTGFFSMAFLMLACFAGILRGLRAKVNVGQGPFLLVAFPAAARPSMIAAIVKFGGFHAPCAFFTTGPGRYRSACAASGGRTGLRAELAHAQCPLHRDAWSRQRNRYRRAAVGRPADQEMGPAGRNRKQAR